MLLNNGCIQNKLANEQYQPCSTAWYQAIEQKESSPDGLEHGADPGSDKWRAVNWVYMA